MKKSYTLLIMFFLIFVSLNLYAADSEILSEVNNWKLTEEKLHYLVSESQLQDAYAKQNVIQRLTDEKVFAEEAKKLKLDNDEELNFKMEIIKNQLLAQKLVAKIAEKINITDKKIKEYYDKNKTEKYKTPKQVKARHILLETKEMAQKILDKLKSGASFIKLAKENSKCPSKDDGGDLGWFKEKDMVPEFSKSAFSLKVGETSDIVKTKFGYHIIKVEDKKDISFKALDEVKDEIKEMLTMEKLKDKLDKIKEKYKVKINFKI